MIYPLKTDVIPLIRSVIAALQPFARAQSVELEYEEGIGRMSVTYHPELLVGDLTRLVCEVVTFTPQEHAVGVRAEAGPASEEPALIVKVRNTGSDLTYVFFRFSSLHYPVMIEEAREQETCFHLRIPYSEEEEVFEKKQRPLPSPMDQPFFSKLKEHLRFHFTSIRNLEKAAAARSEREGVFLKKVHAVIMANLDVEGFNITDLSRSLALSRAQLYRKLKPLIRLSPGQYIRYIRLQKAKEMLEMEDLTIGEVAFRTGFMNQSHFSRAFREVFGFCPSHLKKPSTVPDVHRDPPSTKINKTIHHEPG